MKKNGFAAVMKYAGGFIAWVIGSGFATGQEILQFFASYGYAGIAVLAVNLAGFAALGIILMSHGFDHRDEPDFNHYTYYCGKVVGRIYAVVIPVTLVLLISVLISAAGATLNQYYGVNRWVGTAVMAALLLAAYLAGFERMVRVVSSVSPLVILFTVFVGVFTVCRDGAAFGQIGAFTDELAQLRAAPHWSVSALLYLSLNFLCGSLYYTELGRSAGSRRTAVAGAAVGAVVMVVTISVMTFAIQLNADGILSSEVPTLYLAEKISGVFGVVFSVVLILGMFASSATTLWSFCSGFFRHDKRKNRLFAVGTTVCCTLLGFVPFGSLLSVVYPLIGYAGLVFVGCTVYRGIRRLIDKRKKTISEKES